MFHTGHYNKIVDVLGRRIAVEYSIGTEKGYEAAVAVAGAMAVMLQDDNENFDLRWYLEAIKEKTEHWVNMLNSLEKDDAGFMERLSENLRRFA